MAALEEDDILDDENFQESGFLSFPPEVQAAIDQVYGTHICSIYSNVIFTSRCYLFRCRRGKMKMVVSA